MNPRRAPRPPRTRRPDPASTSARPEASDALVDAAFARWRDVYDGIAPAPDLVARARRAADAAMRRRRRPAAAAIAAAVCTAFVGAFLATRIAARVAGGWTDAAPTGPVACAGTQGPVAVAARSAVREDASGAPATRPYPDRLVADARPAVADGAARLASLLASATALPRPDAATREAWVLASFDPDPRVREAAALLLALAHPAAPSPLPPPPSAATDAAADPAAGTPDAGRAP
ncbi:MAG: hypothetical protein U1E39_07320 [Planctomycetota bacterium]